MFTWSTQLQVGHRKYVGLLKDEPTTLFGLLIVAARWREGWEGEGGGEGRAPRTRTKRTMVILKMMTSAPIPRWR